MKRLITACFVLLAVTIAVGCSINPATGERQFNTLDQNRAIQLGDDAAPKFLKQYGGKIPSSKVNHYVDQLGQQLAAHSERPDLPWKFYAVNSPEVNAFSLPGGKIFITRGLLAKLNNKAQLAGVLGHEIGHINAEHIGQQMSRQQALQIGLAGVGVASQYSNKDWLKVLGAVGGVGGNLYLLKFGRDQEHQADTLGVRYMSRLGYNPVAQIQVMQVLKKASGPGGGGIELFQTHPNPQERIDHLQKLIKNKYPDYDRSGKYRFDQKSYQHNVLQPLKQLPPPPPTPKQQPQENQAG